MKMVTGSRHGAQVELPVQNLAEVALTNMLMIARSRLTVMKNVLRINSVPYLHIQHTISLHLIVGIGLCLSGQLVKNLAEDKHLSKSTFSTSAGSVDVVYP